MSTRSQNPGMFWRQMSWLVQITRCSISRRGVLLWFVLSMTLVFAPTTMFGAGEQDHGDVIKLRAWGVPDNFRAGPLAEADRQIQDEFRRKYPWIDPISTTGLKIAGSTRTFNMIPLMQIAGDIAPDVLYVNFSQSYTYINMKLLYPLEKYIEQLVGVDIPDSGAMSTDDYIAALKVGPRWIEVKNRVPRQCWEVVHRLCPYGKTCPYRKEWNVAPLDKHRHVWAFPVGPLVIGLQYNKALFAEYADQGVEMRAPRDWDELLRWAKIMTKPDKNEFGMSLNISLPGHQFLTFLYSAGGKVVVEEENGDWRCTLDTPEAIDAAYFYARLRLEKIRRGNREYRGVAPLTGNVSTGQIRTGMTFVYLDDRLLQQAEKVALGIGPVPMGPTGKRGSEFNAQMCGIFSGLADDPRRRDAAWKYILFYDGTEARRIRTEKMVNVGLGRFVRPYLLKRFNDDGRYDDIIRRIPKELTETYRIAFENGIPEPYGKNCQYIYDQISKPLGAILVHPDVIEAIDTNNPEKGKAVIREILARATVRINEKMLGRLTPKQQTERTIVAWIVVISVILIFLLVFRKIIQSFTPKEMATKGKWQFGKYKMAYIFMAAAVLSIAMWQYWPLARGTLIAFQNYSVLGDSEWVGMKNFGDVLYDSEFWYSLRISLNYALLFMFFGFCAPIALAFLLTEVPRGKLLFRTIYYLPAVLSGVVVIFLWRSFYAPDGMINMVLNGVIVPINWFLSLLGSEPIQQFHDNWLENRKMVLFFCLLPTAWAGMGPGCLIYLAALKTVPEEIYEAADIDGAGLFAKIFGIALPSIRALVMINFIGAMIGAIRGAGGFVLAMTGGGPWGESGGATEVIGLKIFYTAFGHLRFGAAAAMAWVLGAMLIGFTVIQLRRLSKLEFRTAEKVA